MNEVQPIRDKNKIEEMKIELLKNCYRDFNIIFGRDKYRIKNKRSIKVNS